jgi:endonuclease YncB( thermonuclease family)
VTAVAAVLLVAGVAAQADSDTEPEGTLGTAGVTSSEDSPTTAAPTPTPGGSKTTSHEPRTGEQSPEQTPQSATTKEPASPAPNTKKTPPPKRVTRQPTYVVTHVVDGDTIDLGNGERVRLVGIDTPEVGQCGYDEATAKMERLVLGKRVRLFESDEDRDRYDRLLRYVEVAGKDAGLAQIRSGLAIARYDSRDGYGYHPRETRYIAVDKAVPNRTCPTPEPEPDPQPVLEAPVDSGGGCGGYSPCIPAYPPDLDCADVGGPIYVSGSDPHGLDADGDGVACES